MSGQTLHSPKLNLFPDDLKLNNFTKSGNILYDKIFFAGNVVDGEPQREQNGKWFISTHDYPFDKYPPFINAGAYVMSNAAIRKFYYASYFVKRFRFDDVYLCLVAWKLNVKPFHSEYFWQRRQSLELKDHMHVIASHDFSDPKTMQRVWRYQKYAHSESYEEEPTRNYTTEEISEKVTIVLLAFLGILLGSVCFFICYIESVSESVLYSELIAPD